MTPDIEVAARAALAAMKAVVNGDIGPPRDRRDSTCTHGRYYWEDCGSCVDEWLAQAVAALEAALSGENSVVGQAVAGAPAAVASGPMSASDPILIAALRAGDNGAVNKRLWELLDRADDRLSAIRSAVLMEAAAECFIGPSDEWSEACKSGYLQAADDCAHRIRALAEKEPTT